MRNLNIKNDEAYELASEIAKLTGKSLTLVVTEALRSSKRMMTRAEVTSKWDAIEEDNKNRWKEPFLSTRHGDLLYDEKGLPK